MTALEVRALPRRTVVVQLGAAVALVAVTLPGLDDVGTATRVLQGVAVLLAVTLALAVDEPGAEVLDATATSFAVRVARRLALLASVAAPMWLVALAVVSLGTADVTGLMLTLQAVTLFALALAVAAGLRRWRRMPEPGIAAGPVLLAFYLAAERLPRSVTLMPFQPWGPPWEVVHLRWAAVLLAALSVLVLALSDPATASVRRRSPRAT